ncbi:tautomerase family protein [Bordetella genomosp. 9]|uniref:4-oxalocrotonate tautomerase n=1 Tax=Bordetella genomosp. 9 TaxID=1416803 RepID=A0A1W6Z0N2_9BORD|nr:4-oxalocrotonate tautomerase family protein [Bordetella genomosp. 9]ARP86754.1 4-oxalocrotonate tautomerase [Bordetella genomosp. 9]ARP90747.1 4-oxalocrotonate tautomerase [Bordetella genomosp. 9]
MPIIKVELLAGRSEDQKQAIAKRFTEVMKEEAGVKPESLHIVFHDVPASDWAVAGQLVSKRQNG